MCFQTRRTLLLLQKIKEDMWRILVTNWLFWDISQNIFFHVPHTWRWVNDDRMIFGWTSGTNGKCAVVELIHRRLSVFVWLEINVHLAAILTSSGVFYNQCHFYAQKCVSGREAALRTHRADRAAAVAPGQARWRGWHRAPDSPVRGNLRSESPDSAGWHHPGRPGRPAERCKGGIE